MSPVSPAASYSYAVIRVVPRVERGEFLNVGVILFARTGRMLRALIGPDPERIRQFDPDADVCAIIAHLELFRSVCEAAPDSGPISELPADERFHWLTAPRSTIIQVSAVHEGCTTDAEATLADLFDRYVATGKERI